MTRQMLVGVATRQYARSLEPLPAEIRGRGTSKSSVSRRFVAKTAAQLNAWQSTPLDELDLVGLLLDGGPHSVNQAYLCAHGSAVGIAPDGEPALDVRYHVTARRQVPFVTAKTPLAKCMLDELAQLL